MELLTVMYILKLSFTLKNIFYLFIFREGEGKEKKRERNINVWLPLMLPPLGPWPTTLACAMIRN